MLVGDDLEWVSGCSCALGGRSRTSNLMPREWTLAVHANNSMAVIFRAVI